MISSSAFLIHAGVIGPLSSKRKNCHSNRKFEDARIRRARSSNENGSSRVVRVATRLLRLLRNQLPKPLVNRQRRIERDIDGFDVLRNADRRRRTNLAVAEFGEPF